MSHDSIKNQSKSDDIINPITYYFGNYKIQVKLSGDCLKQEKGTFTHKKVVNIYIAYEKNLWPFTVGQDFTLQNSLFGAVQLTTNADPNKYKYSGYDNEFDASGSFTFPDGSGFGKNVIISGVDTSSSVHIDNKKKDILTPGKGPTQGLDNTPLTAEKEYFTNFTEQQKKFCLSLHYNGVNSYLFFNGVKIYKFKAKHSEINVVPCCLGNV